MMYDITHCHGVDCVTKNECKRYTDKVPDNAVLSWAANLNIDNAPVCPYMMEKLSQ